jgi:hypothetical protein
MSVLELQRVSRTHGTGEVRKARRLAEEALSEVELGDHAGRFPDEENKTPQEAAQYQATRNAKSIDGVPVL